MWHNLHAPHEVSIIRTSSVDASRAERTMPPGPTQSPRPAADELPARLIAAFKSRSCAAPQDSQRHSRVASVSERFRAPQREHSCELGNRLSAFSNATPYNSHLYSSIRTNSDIPESDTERATVSRHAFDIERFAHNAAATLGYRRSGLRVSSHVANPLVQFTLLEKTVALRTFPAPRRCSLASCPSARFNGFGYAIPSEHTASVLTPTSTPMIAPSRFVGGSSPVSTVTAANRRPALRDTVTIATSPAKRNSSCASRSLATG